MNTTRNRSGAVIGILLPVGLICLFAFCSLALALMGGQAYKNINNGIDDSYGSTVAAAYLRTKLSQNNHGGAIALRDVEGVQMLVILSGEEQADARQYETRIFVRDGALREGIVSAGSEDDLAQSIEIAQVTSCNFSISDDGLLEIEIISEHGAKTRLAFALAGEGDA